MKRFIYKPHSDGYNVFLDGEYLGFVRKFVQRFNLRRVIVIRGWRATAPDGTKLYSSNGTTCGTRVGAAEFLLARHGVST